MGPRARATTLAERPSSSDGSSKHQTRRGLADRYDKRQSRDDLALVGTSFDRSNYSSYHMPIRGQITPESSPRNQGHHARMATLKTLSPPMTANLYSDIGMALGSPTQAPASFAPHPIRPIPWSSGLANVEKTPEAIPEEGTSKSKPKKWGLFRSKSKRVRPDATPAPKRFPSDAAINVISSPHSHHLASPPPSASPKRDKLERSHSKHKPIVIRSQTEPLSISRHIPHREEHRSRERNNSAFAQVPQVPSNRWADLYEKPCPPPPHNRLLDVEIPSITMERYSIMFGKVLQSRPPSTLLARRQANVDRLKPIHDVREPPQLAFPRGRRATSPQPNGLQSFSVQSSQPDSPRMLSPHLRSNTLPNLASSPSPRHHISGSHTHHNQPRMSPHAHRSSEHAIPTSRFQKTSPREKEPPFRQPVTLQDSPRSMNSRSPEIHIKDRMKPTFVEPRWHMVSAEPPPASTTSTASMSSRKESSSSVNSTRTNETIPSQAPENEAEKALRTAVEHSIQRQISVSHQQRMMLGTFASSVPRGAAGDTGSVVGMVVSSSGARIPMGRNERLAETKISTPTLVHPENVGEPGGLAPRQVMHRHQRSVRAVVEGGD